MSFSSAHGIFSRIDHMWGQRISLNKLKKIEIISSKFSNHSAVKLAINKRKEAGKFTSVWIKHHTHEQPMDQTRNQKGNQNVS